MVLRSAFLLVMLVGCDRVFGLAARPPDPDASGPEEDAREDARGTCLVDLFSDGAAGLATRWTVVEPAGTAVRAENGTLTVALPPSTDISAYVTNKQRQDLTGAIVTVRVDGVIGVGNAETFFHLTRDDVNHYYFSFYAGFLAAGVRENTSDFDRTRIVYEPVMHRYWRFQHVPSVPALRFLTSPDGVAWDELYTERDIAPFSSMLVELGAQEYYGGVPNPNGTAFDDYERCIP